MGARGGGGQDFQGIWKFFFFFSPKLFSRPKVSLGYEPGNKARNSGKVTFDSRVCYQRVTKVCYQRVAKVCSSTKYPEGLPEGNQGALPEGLPEGNQSVLLDQIPRGATRG